MPLSEKTRVEVYLPDQAASAYRDFLEAIDREFTYTFGGCTIVRGLQGRYLSRLGQRVRDRITLIYTDLPLSLKEQRAKLVRYADRLREVAFAALNEEAVLVAVYSVHHSE